MVVNEERIVLGLLRKHALGGDPRAVVETVMEIGPSTFRPSALAREAMDYLRRHDVDSVVVTTSGGRLVGLLQRDQS